MFYSPSRSVGRLVGVGSVAMKEDVLLLLLLVWSGLVVVCHKMSSLKHVVATHTARKLLFNAPTMMMGEVKLHFFFSMESENCIKIVSQLLLPMGTSCTTCFSHQRSVNYSLPSLQRFEMILYNNSNRKLFKMSESCRLRNAS